MGTGGVAAIARLLARSVVDLYSAVFICNTACEAWLHARVSPKQQGSADTHAPKANAPNISVARYADGMFASWNHDLNLGGAFNLGEVLVLVAGQRHPVVPTAELNIDAVDRLDTDGITSVAARMGAHIL
ncbi:hypothetical protein LTR53_003902 [Teratosphaeriaceae sp. CCFEE 6253]|nr:hypothetical protein LTR53_003902 [Teratosphaeriaceae sp. CCFEE 6253]